MKRKGVSVEQVSEYFKRENSDSSLILLFLHTTLDRIIKRYEVDYCSLIPIRIVACLESYFHDIYANLIDSDHDARNRLSSKWKDWNISLRDLNLLEDNYLTLGDFISFQVPCNNVDDIINILSLLKGEDLFEKIKQKEDGVSLLSVMNTIFKLRHVFAHESALSIVITKTEAIDYLNNTIQFISYIDEFINTEDLKTTRQQIEYAYNWYQASSLKLKKLIDKLKGILNEDGFDSLGYIEIWEKYREEKAQYERKVFEGGSYEQVAYLSSLASTTDDEYANLKRHFKHFLRRL